MKTILMLLIVGLSISAISCTAVPDSAPGINPAENAALISTYYWKPEFGIPTHDRSSLAALMDKSVDPELDGERAEGHSSSLVTALASTGDDFFASVLESRSEEVQKSVEYFVSSAWTFNKLKYPKTQAIYDQKKEAQQAAP
jgi:hypothetical protein